MRIGLPSRAAYSLSGAVIAVLTATTAQTVHAQAQPGMVKPAIVIVDPMGTDAFLADAHPTPGPLAQHHVVFSPTKSGTRHIEIGYNDYPAGFKVNSVYAFKQADGLCYVPSGMIEITSDGVVVKLTSHMVMWRPAGAMTEHVEAAQDTVTICAVSPARDEKNKANLGEAEVSRWNGDPALQPHVHFYAVNFISVEAPGEKDLALRSVLERRVVSLHKDGSAKLDLTHFTFKVGAKLRDSPKLGEQVCWLETGKMELSSEGKSLPLNSRNFLYRPEGVKIDELRALKDSSLVCWSASGRVRATERIEELSTGAARAGHPSAPSGK